jgi:hypothetical protein
MDISYTVYQVLNIEIYFLNYIALSQFNFKEGMLGKKGFSYFSFDAVTYFNVGF